MNNHAGPLLSLDGRLISFTDSVNEVKITRTSGIYDVKLVKKIAALGYFERDLGEQTSFALGRPRKIQCSALADDAASSSHFSLPYRLNWYEAAKACHRKGARLATLSSDEQTTKILRSVEPSQEPLWIGASNVDSLSPTHYQWTNGDALTYQRWTKPPVSLSLQCAKVRPEGDWESDECMNTLRPLCELEHDFIDYKSTPCPDCFHGNGAHYRQCIQPITSQSALKYFMMQ